MSAARHQRPTVLLVDDSPALRRLYADFIRRSCQGVELVEVVNGLEAMHRLAMDVPPPVAIVLDLHMPITGGLAVLKWCAERGCRVPTVVVAGVDANHPDALRAVEMGARFLAKPFRSDDLLTALREVTGRGAAA